MASVTPYLERKYKQVAEAQARADRVRLTGKPLEIRPWSWHTLKPAAVLVLIAVIAYRGASASGSAAGQQNAAILFVIAAICGLLGWRSRSHVALRLSSDGVETASHGFIPWESIVGMRIGSLAYPPIDLLMRIPLLFQLTSQMKPMARAFYRLRFGPSRLQLRYPLNYSHAEAEVLARTAEKLWEMKTGRTNTWFPNDPELSRRLQQVHAHVSTLPEPSPRAQTQQSGDGVKGEEPARP
jgi:hypothetical protein